MSDTGNLSCRKSQIPRVPSSPPVATIWDWLGCLSTHCKGVKSPVLKFYQLYSFWTSILYGYLFKGFSDLQSSNKYNLSNFRFWLCQPSYSVVSKKNIQISINKGLNCLNFSLNFWKKKLVHVVPSTLNYLVACYIFIYKNVYNKLLVNLVKNY